MLPMFILAKPGRCQCDTLKIVQVGSRGGERVSLMVYGLSSWKKRKGSVVGVTRRCLLRFLGFPMLDVPCTILSRCGVQDPLSPLGFALSLQPIVEKIREEVPGLLINA